jgi:ribonuclease Z
MKLTFLGTSAGKPTKERNVSALALEFDQDNKWYLFDCGEATQNQLLRSSLSTSKLDTIFITHLHGDHYYGLLGLISSKKFDNCLKPLSIYGPLGIKKFLECAVDISEKKLGYKLEIIEFKSEDEFKFDKFSLKVLPLVHSIESFAFFIIENDITNKINEPIFGRKIIIAGDNSQPEILGDYLRNLDLLVHECTYTQKVYDNLKVKFMHTTAKDLGFTAEKMHVKNLIANHINPRFNKSSNMNIDVVSDEIKSHYKGIFFIANDFDVYYLKKNILVNNTNNKGSLSSSSAIILT